MTRKFLPLLLTALLSASALAAAPPVEYAPASTSTSEDAQALAEAARLIRTEAGTRRLILLGEMHGTREAPKLLAGLATAYAQDEPVLIGMELSSSLQPVVDEFMASDGGKLARAKLLAAPEWHVPRKVNDGRRNLEVISLIGHAQSLKQQGRDVRFLMFDNPRVDGGDAAFRNKTIADSVLRDKAMAHRIRKAFSLMPSGRLLSLSGGVHAWLRKPLFEPDFQEPMGSHLRDLEPFSVDIAARGGEFWACSGEVCGPMQQRAGWKQSSLVGDGRNHLRVVLPRFTIAPLIPE